VPRCIVRVHIVLSFLLYICTTAGLGGSRTYCEAAGGKSMQQHRRPVKSDNLVGKGYWTAVVQLH
jgi:hypothetical protein